jgi:hypothetical protein
MGGRAFKTTTGMTLSERIMRDEIVPTLDDFLSKIPSTVGVGKVRLLGSAGKRAVSNDIDISICPACPVAEDKTFKRNLLAALKSIMGEEHVKLVGHNISVNHPIVSPDAGRQKLRVQIDVMISKDPDSTAWLMAGTGEDEVKGKYRNMLLSYVAKVRSNDLRRITISYPGGIQSEERGCIVAPRNENPNEVFKVLGIRGDPEALAKFESLLDALLEQNFDLEGFESYMAGALKRDPEQARRALEVFRAKLGPSESNR